MTWSRGGTVRSDRSKHFLKVAPGPSTNLRLHRTDVLTKTTTMTTDVSMSFLCCCLNLKRVFAGQRSGGIDIRGLHDDASAHLMTGRPWLRLDVACRPFFGMVTDEWVGVLDGSDAQVGFVCHETRHAGQRARRHPENGRTVVSPPGSTDALVVQKMTLNIWTVVHFL